MYRERSQPKDRQNLGFLEKKQDWSKRSKYFKQKRKQLKILEKKAENKNPDEFYFKMQNAEQIGGEVHLNNSSKNKSNKT